MNVAGSLIKIAQQRTGMEKWSNGKSGERPERFLGKGLKGLYSSIFSHESRVSSKELCFRTIVFDMLIFLFVHELCNSVLRHIDRIFACNLHVRKICNFRPISRRISETAQDRTKVAINDKTLHTRFRFRLLVLKSTTLDDLERPLHTLYQKYFWSPPRKVEWR